MIYLDANATTALRPEARDAVLRVFSETDPMRNPSSIHAAGRAARRQLTHARTQLLRLLALGQSVDADVTFTSGGTEGCNMLVHGLLAPILRGGKGHAIASAIEHPAMLEPLKRFSNLELSLVTTGRDGIIDPETLCAALRADTCFVTLMAANNETGAIQPVAAVARLLRSKGFSGPIVSDMSQAVGKSEISIADLFEAGVTGIALSGHKFGTPSGIGAIALNTGKNALCFELEPHVVGGAQELGRRSGTENLAGIAALGSVAEKLVRALPEELIRIRGLRELLWEEIARVSPETVRLTPVDSAEEIRALSNTLFIHTPGLRGDDLVVALDLNGLCASAGSACSSGKQGVSHVTAALGLQLPQAREVVRLSIDWNETEAGIRAAGEIFGRVCKTMRSVDGAILGAAA